MLSDCKGTIKRAKNKEFYSFFVEHEYLRHNIYMAKVQKISDLPYFFFKKVSK